MVLINGTSELGEHPEIGAGPFPRPHARVLAWPVEAVYRELDCPVTSERSNGAVRKLRNRLKYGGSQHKGVDLHFQ